MSRDHTGVALLKTIISYNEQEIKTDGSLEELGNRYNVWVDLVEPAHEEILELGSKLNLDTEKITAATSVVSKNKSYISSYYVVT